MPETPQPTTGFDAPVFDPKDDHLNRWPLARQIYNVAANGPPAWSARIGVYGEWGTGKTSVLKFVASMANADGHIVVWFDPWGYSSKPDLWHAFVMKCCDEIEESLGGITAAGTARRKSYFKKARDLLGKGVSAVPGDYGTVASGALDLLKGAFAFGPEDLKKLLADLEGKRVVVLIDDLDRTAAELVPEILYALKEVMDIPGFSFICGFDPVVVGEVLGTSHRGFGDGLKFLEKIIDYPIWLPPPTPEGLMKIALADNVSYCGFVPVAEVRAIVPLLPHNPRAIRQFIRLLSLLKSQVDRYCPSELKWSVILAASLIKVRHPRLAPQLLNNQEFWRGLTMTQFMAESTDQTKVDTEIKEHIERCAGHQAVAISDSEKKQVMNGLRLILGSGGFWGLGDISSVVRQVSMTESPPALTGREFEDCLKTWSAAPSIETLKAWIAKHAVQQHCREVDVAEELSAVVIRRYRHDLDLADTAFTRRQKGHQRKQAKLVWSLLKCMVTELGVSMPNLEAMEWLPLPTIMQDLLPLADDLRTVHHELWPLTEKLMVGLVINWKGEFELLRQAVRSIRPYHSSHVNGKEARKVAHKLNELLDSRLGGIAAAGFEEAGFIERVSYRTGGSSELHGIMLQVDGALWAGQRKKVLATLRKAKRSAVVRENAYAFLHWMKFLLHCDNPDWKKSGMKMFADSEIMISMWNAATGVPFEGLHAHRLHDLPQLAKGHGFELTVPPWWQPAIDRHIAMWEKQANQTSESESVKSSSPQEPTAAS